MEFFYEKKCSKITAVSSTASSFSLRSLFNFNSMYTSHTTWAKPADATIFHTSTTFE